MIIEDKGLDHEYLPIDGTPQFTQASAKLILGENSAAISEKRVKPHPSHFWALYFSTVLFKVYLVLVL